MRFVDPFGHTLGQTALFIFAALAGWRPALIAGIYILNPAIVTRRISFCCLISGLIVSYYA